MPELRPSPTGAGGPRLLMTRLRTMMASEAAVSVRLNRIVELIAATMVADVCSIYLRAKDNFFELVATEGLHPDAVGRTRLGPNEGLVGEVAATAQPLSVQDAPSHPAFAYRPETGEDPYHAFLGVPLLKGGRVVGVLVVQNTTERTYDDEEVETLQTIAMVVSEMASSAMPDAADPGGSLVVRPTAPVKLTGRGLSSGVAIGPALLHDPIVPITKIFASDVNEELDRLNRGLSDLQASIDDLLAKEGSPFWGESRDVLETYRLMAHDPSWQRRLREAVGSGLSAEAAADSVRREHRVRLENAKEVYLRERLHDLEDLDNRLLRILVRYDNGRRDVSAQGATQGSVLVARRLGPAELLEYRDMGLKAIVLEEAQASSHAVIVARALGVPTVGGLPALMSNVDTDDLIIVDAETGTVRIRPDANHVSVYEERVALRSERQAEFAKLRDEPAITLDGVRIELMTNAGLTLDLNNLGDAGGDGIGLFRTEFQFLVSETLPKLGDQIDFYKTVLDAVGDKPVLFRTLDLGGDKVIPAMTHAREENPALGWRSIRLALDRKGLFRRQIRALIRAAEGRPLSVMFPLVTTADEFFSAKAMVMDEVRWTEHKDLPVPVSLSVGAMVETPALAYAIPQLEGEVDFLSVGTNDLMQYFFASDRDNPLVADRYDVLSRPALQFLKDIHDRGRDIGARLSVCGEAAGTPLEALALIALGYRRLSMAANDVGRVKQMVRSVNLEGFLPDFLTYLGKRNVGFRKDLLNLATHYQIML